MINRVERGGFNYLESIAKDKQRKRNKTSNSGVVVEITTAPNKEETLDPQRLEEIKKLIKEGNYPLDHRKLAEKIVDFLMDGE